jgi:hypothetical protein
MAKANWMRVAREIAVEIPQAVDHSVTLSLTELFHRGGGDHEPGDFRSRNYWAAEQRGEPHACGFRRSGLVIGFWPDVPDQPVESITFRLDRVQARV